MGLKADFLEKVKAGYPEFNPETDSVEINFEGGGDSFGSFYNIDVTNYESGTGYKSLEGNWDLDEDYDFLFKLLDAADVQYSWINSGTTGSIKFEDGELTVETIVTDESWGRIEDEE
jgi:hypothetical protein